jgi:hypothetical protein
MMLISTMTPIPVDQIDRLAGFVGARVGTFYLTFALTLYLRRRDQ